MSSFHTARIIRKQILSSRVLGLTLDVPTLQQFEPGQWVDFCVPSFSWIGGFSLVSSPKELPTCQLAIKASSDTPSRWVHEQSRVGDTVQIRVGGSCIYQAAKASTRVFCAGGIGIAPILCMFRHHMHFRDDKSPTRLLYSATSSEELVFQDELRSLMEKYGSHGDDYVWLTVTREEWKEQPTPNQCIEYRQGRQLINFLSQQPAASRYYLCGPPTMMDEAVKILKRRGVSDSNIIYEKWW